MTCSCRVVTCLGTPLSGTGSFTDPLVLPCETPWIGVEGTFIDITPGDNPVGDAGNGHMPTIAVKLSTDAGNTTVAGSDGGLYTPGTSCEAIQDCVGPMLGGLTGWDYNDNGEGGVGFWQTTGNQGQIAYINAAGDMAWQDPAPAGLITAADTSSIDMTVAGNIVTGQVITGCGLTTDGGTGPVRANVSGVWNFPCANTNGAPIYCDDNGQLRSVPEHTCVNAPRVVSLQTWDGVGPGIYGSGQAIANINNPSLCRSMMVVSDYTVSTEDTSAAGLTAVRSLLHVDIGLSYLGNFPFWVGNPSVISFGTVGPDWLVHASNDDTTNIGPGASSTVIISAIAQIDVGTSGHLVLAASAMLWGCTQ